MTPHWSPEGKREWWSHRGCRCKYCKGERQRVSDVRAYHRRVAGGRTEVYPALELKQEALAKMRRMYDAGRSTQTLSTLLGYKMSGRGGNYGVEHLLASDIASYRMSWRQYDRIMELDEVTAPLSFATERRGGRYVRDIGVLRRLQALNATGRSFRWMGEQVGSAHLNDFVVTPGKKMSTQLALDIKAMYARYEMTRPEPSPSVSRAKAAAERAGYAGPMAWDPDTIDNPDAWPEYTGACNTPAGYKRHERDGSKPCPACRNALAEDQAQRRADKTNGGVRRRPGRPAASGCGTRNGYLAHKKAGEEPCQPCVEGQRRYHGRMSKTTQLDRELEELCA